MKGFDLALWKNTYKQPGTRQPDAKGSLSIPISVLRELVNAYQNKTLPTERDERNNGQEIIKIPASAWLNNSDNEKAPKIKAEVRGWQEHLDIEAKKAAQADQNAASGGGGDWGFGGGQQQPPAQQQQPPAQQQPVGAGSAASNGAGNNHQASSFDIPF